MKKATAPRASEQEYILAVKSGRSNAVRPARDHQRRLFDGMPYDYLQVCGTPWSGNEYGPGQTAIWTMR